MHIANTLASRNANGMIRVGTEASKMTGRLRHDKDLENCVKWGKGSVFTPVVCFNNKTPKYELTVYFI
jgi:hypothetical protein